MNFYPQVYRCCLIVLFLLNLFCVDGISSACGTGDRNEIVVVAFINVYDETSECELLNLRGLQHMAMLQKIVSEINERESFNVGMRMTLLVVNTCSLNEDRVNAALTSLVMSHQTCPNPPLLLGFIGPEKHLTTVQKVTSEFHKYHILPFAPDARKSVDDNSLSLYIGNNRLQLRSKIILATLNQLKWKSLFVVIGDIDKNVILNYMLNDLQLVCVTGLVQIPKDKFAIGEFYSNLVKEFKESNSEGILLVAEDPGVIRPLLREMRTQSRNETSNPPILLYLYQVGLKSWELPANFSIVLLQETSETKRGFNLNTFYNTSLWDEYYVQYEVDYKHDAFSGVYDTSIAPLEYALQLYWNAAKYAKKIKCDLGSASIRPQICYDMLHVNPLEWKSFLYKASYYHAETSRKISLEMNIPVTVKIYFMNSAINFPQLIGRITDIGIVDLQMNLQTAVPKREPTLSFNKCIPPVKTSSNDFNPLSMDHESNWLAVFSKKMKSLISLNGLLPPEWSDQINECLFWAIGIIIFFLGLILITKIVYSVFRVQTDEERDEAKRRKLGRTTRVASA